jgi:eukaryotic-like serine/threonine-protein kinase
MRLAAGSRLSTYEIVAPLGAGGMGEVYRAKDVRLGRHVALKVLPETLAQDADHLARFEHEARTVAALNHPNIVTLFSVEDENHVRFLTMELVEGQSLADLITPGGLPIARVLDLGVGIADALAAAHERGVVHRDLKPANVMVNREGRVKVLDFGLAKPARGSEQGLTQALTLDRPAFASGTVSGTAPYMAPEQIRAESVDARTDLFALGIVLYELVAGRRPFAGPTDPAMGAAILHDAPEPLARLRTGLPSELERIISRCLEKDPRKRPGTAVEVGNELRRLRRTLERDEASSEKIASIAVLPFVNRSRDEADEYFSDGLADELLNVLAKIRRLRVAARTSSFHFKGKDTTIAEVGRALQVATVLEGSVRKSGTRVRISVQLVKVEDGYHLWSETYDRTLDDIFAVQDDIAQAVVKELRATLLGEAADSDANREAKADVARAARGRATSPEAHRLFLLARHFYDRGTREDHLKVIDYLNSALAIDGQFALAWAQLAMAYSKVADMGWTSLAEGYARAREAAGRSLTLEPDLAEGHAELAWIRFVYDWDWRGAESAYARALQLAPGNLTILRRAGVLAATMGRLDAAIDLTRRAMEQDPLSSVAYTSHARLLVFAGRYVEAEEAHRKALELAPKRACGLAFLALAMSWQRRHEESIAEAMRELEEVWRLWALAIVYQVAGHTKESGTALHELSDKYAENAAYQIAEAHAVREEVDAAFAWLERAYTQRDGGLKDVTVSPYLRSLHGDLRWQEFLAKMGLGQRRLRTSSQSESPT